MERIKFITKRLEDNKYPLLGPNIKGLSWTGLWFYEKSYKYFIVYFVQLNSVIFVICEFVELFHMRNDLMAVLFNISVSALGLVTLIKALFFRYNLSHWRILIENISREEIASVEDKDHNIKNVICDYTTYSRIITYSYWSVVLLTNMVIIISPFLKFVTMSELIKNGTEPYPQIVSSWVPFDKTTMPGYLMAVVYHAATLNVGAGVLAVFDANSFAIMTFLKGQLKILRFRCTNIFGQEEPISKQEVLRNIKECHRLHNFILEQYKLFDNLQSPVMFLYVLICSLMICSSVVQLSLGEATAYQQLWVVEYTIAISTQLFLFCWHSNEVQQESRKVDLGVYSSDWWRSDVEVRRQVLLLAGKLAPSFILKAGPFTNLSVTTFIEIIKGSYSFYTLFTQMHEQHS